MTWRVNWNKLIAVVGALTIAAVFFALHARAEREFREHCEDRGGVAVRGYDHGSQWVCVDRTVTR